MLLITFLTACSGGGDTGTDIVGDATAGEAIYTSNCAACHGADGAGTDAYPSLVDEVPGLDDAAIEDIVVNGKGSMAGFPNLADQDLADLLAYLRATFG